MASTKSLPTSLPRLLSLLPSNGLQSSIYQTRWAAKGLPVPTPQATASASASEGQSCRWVVEKVKLGVSEEGRPWARAWGSLYWKGKRVTPAGEMEKISGSTKYKWLSEKVPPALVRHIPAPVAPEAAVEGEEAAQQ